MYVRLPASLGRPRSLPLLDTPTVVGRPATRTAAEAFCLSSSNSEPCPPELRSARTLTYTPTKLPERRKKVSLCSHEGNGVLLRKH